MAWTPPTVEEFKIRFTLFANVADETVQAYLDEATAEVGTDWVERDRTPAVLNLAAHLLAVLGGVQGLGGGNGSEAVTGIVKRRKVGDVETEFATVGSASTGGGEMGSLAWYRSTLYGQRFLQLMRRNFPPIAVV